ncbi:hypothetical protein VKT23_019619 [Stygiomarasmius scandens]|uniref:Uncharacterized protein n=1 Tax=Marasmiellus scandens TaxID=2682957 RepID=A0ABR1INV0_9AGAR
MEDDDYPIKTLVVEVMGEQNEHTRNSKSKSSKKAPKPSWPPFPPRFGLGPLAVAENGNYKGANSTTPTRTASATGSGVNEEDQLTSDPD